MASIEKKAPKEKFEKNITNEFKRGFNIENVVLSKIFRLNKIH